MSQRTYVYWALLDPNNNFLPKLYTDPKYAQAHQRDIDKGWGKFEVVEVELKVRKQLKVPVAA